MNLSFVAYPWTILLNDIKWTNESQHCFVLSEAVGVRLWSYGAYKWTKRNLSQAYTTIIRFVCGGKGIWFYVFCLFALHTPVQTFTNKSGTACYHVEWSRERTKTRFDLTKTKSVLYVGLSYFSGMRPHHLDGRMLYCMIPFLPIFGIVLLFSDKLIYKRGFENNLLFVVTIPTKISIHHEIGKRHPTAHLFLLVASVSKLNNL